MAECWYNDDPLVIYNPYTNKIYLRTNLFSVNMNHIVLGDYIGPDIWRLDEY